MAMNFKSIALAASAGLALTVPTIAEARTMRAVGSSTVYPFAKMAAERVARANPRLGSPIIESTGTGGGFKLFCAGVGERFPDIANASRRMKSKEAAQCAANGVKDVTEIQIGLDGVALATARQTAHFGHHPARPLPGDRQDAVRQAQPGQDLEGRQRQAAGAADPRLRPAVDLGHARRARRIADDPAVRSQCLDGRAEEERRGQVQGGVHRRSAPTAPSSKPARTTISSSRSSPPIPARSASSATASSRRMRRKVKGVAINGVAPNYATISTFQYPGARPLYIYVKNAHVRAIPAIRAFVAEITKESAIGPKGYMLAGGLVAAPNGVRARAQQAARTLSPVKFADLK